MPRISELETVHVETMPDKLELGKIYVSQKFQLCIHKCACGECGINTVTPFRDGSFTTHQGWEFKEEDGKVTLHPSIGNMRFPCGSHYWVQNGKVVWC